MESRLYELRIPVVSEVGHFTITPENLCQGTTRACYSLRGVSKSMPHVGRASPGSTQTE